MKERIKKHVNKNLKMMLIIGVVIVIAMGILLMLISGNADDRSQVPIDPTAEQQDDKKDKNDRPLAEIGDHPGVSDVALDMYNARVDDISNTAEVAKLLEATEMRETLGGYLATLELKEDNDILVIKFEKELLAGEDIAFNEEATWFAEQFLALIEEADEVKWVYKVEKDAATIAAEKAELEKAAEEAAKEAAKKDKNKDNDKEKDKDKDKSDKKETEKKEIVVEKYKTVEMSLTVKQADELLGTEVKGYSESPELVQTLLNNQKGIV